MTFHILTEAELNIALLELPDWHHEGTELTTKYDMGDFKNAMKLVQMVATEAERINHHPTWQNTYSKISFRLSTHDAGDKVTDLDLKLAAFISLVARRLKHG